MIIQQDTRQKKKHHTVKEQWFKNNGITIVNSKMLVGDYMIPSDGSVSVDTKKDCAELYSNLITQHDRFKAECELANECGIQLYVLVENEDGITCIDEILRWKNPQYIMYLAKQRRGIKIKPPVSNQQLLKIMHTMEKKYGVKFVFCHPFESGRKILELLGVDYANINKDSAAS